MLTPSNKIIIVDNELEELYRLGKVFLDSGLTCKTFEYDELYDNPLMDVRIAFFDIKLSPSGGGSDEQTFSILMQALKSYIDIKNKPFILIFWTEHKDLVDRFKRYVLERMDGSLPSPFMIDCIDKLEINNPQSLKEKLNLILESPLTAILFDFEDNALQAASKTINKFFEIIPSNDEWGENTSFTQNFESVFSKIASQSLGFEHAKENPDKAIYDALLPILNHEFVTLESATLWENQLKTLAQAKKFEDLSYPEGFSQGNINSIFHIDINSKVDLSTRGAVHEYNFQIPFVNKILFSLIPYFEKIQKEMNQRFAKFISFSDKISDEKKEIIRGHSQFVVIEISASCDFSQNKSRNPKYVLGLITPKVDNEYLDTENISQSVFYKELPVFNISNRPEFILNNRDFQIWINFNFVISNFKRSKNIGKPLFILKKEIIDMIGNRYANHVSRIGITSF